MDSDRDLVTMGSLYKVMLTYVDLEVFQTKPNMAVYGAFGS